MLKQIQRETVADSVIRQLRALIDSGEWVPGMKVPSELTLAKELGVGRSSIREALKALQAIGLVSRRRDGTYVDRALHVGISADSLLSLESTENALIAHLYEARRILEGEIAWLAAQQCDDNALRDLEEIRRKMLELPRDAYDEYLDLDMEFHCRLCTVVNNPILAKMWLVVYQALVDRRDVVRLARRKRLSDPDWPVTRYRSIHEPLLSALRTGDAELARETIHVVLSDMERSLPLDASDEGHEAPSATHASGDLVLQGFAETSTE